MKPGNYAPYGSKTEGANSKCYARSALMPAGPNLFAPGWSSYSVNNRPKSRVHPPSLVLASSAGRVPSSPTLEAVQGGRAFQPLAHSPQLE